MTSGEVVFSLCDYAQEFVREYKNSKLDQKVIDAIVVSYINYFASMQCCIDLAMHTEDLRDGKKMSTVGVDLQKDLIFPSLNFWKDVYNKSSIVERININSHINECNGKAEFDNAEAIKLIEEFIKGYMAA